MILLDTTYFLAWLASERSKNSMATRPSTELRAYPTKHRDVSKIFKTIQMNEMRKSGLQREPKREQEK